MKYMKTLLMIVIMLLGIPTQRLSAEIQYGAFDPPYWNGLVILEKDTAFAFRFIIRKDNDTADGYDTFHIVERVGPFSPDGRYAEVSFNPSLPFHKGNETPILEKKAPPSDLVRLRYSKYQNGVLGCLHIPENTRIEILFYNPWEPKVDYQEFNQTITGETGDLTWHFIPVDSSFERVERKETPDRSLSIRIPQPAPLFYFYAGFDHNDFSPAKIETILNAAREVYEASRPRVTGEWEGLISSISDNLAWMKLYQPDKKRIYLPAGRRWMFPKPDGTTDLWTIFEWDAFFNALEAGVEDRLLAKNEIAAVLDCQYPTGDIPNWRSANSGSPDRAQPPVGAFAVLKTYYKTKDLSILADSYERLKKFHLYWKTPGINGNPRRDGNADGLLEWGSDTDLLFAGMPEWEKGASGTQRAAWESGQDDLPNFDNVPFDEKKNTLVMNCLDLSALFALDAEMMMQIASILGKKEDAAGFKKEYEEIKNKINRDLWNKDFYYDRFWDGKFSLHKAASNFYPLLAGVPSKDQVDKLIQHLLSGKEFWGDYVLPTISRDNPAFKDQQYWRGTIWPPTNYLVYQGLKRYYLDETAAEFAVKSAALFLNSWQTYGLCRENYDSVTGEGGGQRYQSWGPLFALILLEDFIDVTPFEGFRVGNLAAGAPRRGEPIEMVRCVDKAGDGENNPSLIGSPGPAAREPSIKSFCGGPGGGFLEKSPLVAEGKNLLQNIRLQADLYTLEADARGLLLIKNREKIFEYKGRAVLRHLEMTRETLTLEAHVISETMDFYPLVFQGKTFTVESEGQKVVKMKDFIRVPAGTTKIILKNY